MLKTKSYVPCIIRDVYLQSNPTGTLHLMSLMLPLWRMSIAMLDRPLPGGEIQLLIKNFRSQECVPLDTLNTLPIQFGSHYHRNWTNFVLPPSMRVDLSMRAFLIFVVIFSPNICLVYHNATVDDTSPLITYTGVWSPLSEDSNSLDYGGAHHVSCQPGATATFSFTGIAFYYMAPLWPYNVTTVVTVDGISTTVNLQDPQTPQQPCCDGAETKPSQILASFMGLDNRVHSVVCSMEPGNGFVVVDAFVSFD